jgi:membrane protein
VFVATVFRVLKDTLVEWYSRQTHQAGAALAYYGVFALAPTLLIAIAVAGAVYGEEAAEGRLAETLTASLSPVVADAVASTLSYVYATRSALSATAVGFGILAFAATGLFNQLQSSLNAIWDLPRHASGGILKRIRRRLLSFVMVLSIGALLLVSLVINSVFVAVQQSLPDDSPLDLTYWIKQSNGWVALVLLTALFATIYKWLPDTQVAWRDIIPGALLTAVLFFAGNYLIGAYLRTFPPGTAFGPAGSLIVVMVWVYHSSQIILLGAEFTRKLELRRSGGDAEPGVVPCRAKGHDLG